MDDEAEQPIPSSSLPLPSPVLIKYRFPKTYRHTKLDALLTRQRLTAEARALVRCARMNVQVPGLRMVDHRNGILAIEWIDGWSVREVLGGGQEDDEGVIDEEELAEVDDAPGADTQAQDELRALGVDNGMELPSIQL